MTPLDRAFIKAYSQQEQAPQPAPSARARCRWPRPSKRPSPTRRAAKKPCESRLDIGASAAAGLGSGV